LTHNDIDVKRAAWSLFKSVRNLGFMANLQSFERAEYQQVKADLHRKILDRLDLESWADFGRLRSR